MNVGEIVVVIIVIIAGVTLMFVFPLMTMADNNDDVVQSLVEAKTAEFVENVRNTGVLTLDDLDAFVQDLAATGHTYKIELEADLADPNPNIKTTQVTTTKKGEYLYYVICTSQIEDILNTEGSLIFKEGDIISATVINTDVPLSQVLRNFFYQIRGDNAYQIGTEQAVMIIVNGAE